MLSGLAGALLIGLSLGLLGSGGSILTVPVLHYLFGQPEQAAIGGSLLVVGVIAAVAAVPHALARQVAWPDVAWFGLPGMAVAGWRMLAAQPPAPAASAPAGRRRGAIVAGGTAVGLASGIAGSLLGHRLATRTPQALLRKIFGSTLLLLATAIGLDVARRVLA